MDFRLGIVTEMRAKLMEVDKLLMLTLNERLRIVKQLQEFKRESGIAPVDRAREHFVARHLERLRPTIDEELVLTTAGLDMFVGFVFDLTKSELGIKDDGSYSPETVEIAF